MNATNRWLDKLAEADKAKGGTGSDYRLAQIMEVDRQLVSKYRRGLVQLGDGPALTLAEFIGVHALRVIGEIQADVARDVRTKNFWTAQAKRHGGKVAAVILAAALGVVPRPGSANWEGKTPSPAGENERGNPVYYVK